MGVRFPLLKRLLIFRHLSSGLPPIVTFKIAKMKNLRIKNLGIYILLFVIAGCNDDFVNTEPLDEVGEAAVWNDAALAEAFVLDIYNGIGQGGFDEEMMASLTDEALFTHAGRGINTITESRVTPADVGNINYTYEWDDLYRRIRSTNIALTKLEEPGFENQEGVADRLTGESLFLRAFFYHNLLRWYGGVPLVDKVYTLNSEDVEIARNTFEENVEFIVADLDKAIQLLQGQPDIEGRASAEAAMALKARVLLYAASDLHDIPTASAKSPLIASYQYPELLGYVSGDQTQRWQRAKAAAQAVVDLNMGYKLNLSEPVSPEQGEANFMALSLGGGSAVADPAAETEIIFGRYFVAAKGEGGRDIGRYNGPNGYHNWSGNTPTQNLVDAYTLIDGTEFDWDNPEHAAAPYENRDPRFYASILYDGADWKPRTADVAGTDPFNQIQAGVYEVVNDAGEVVTYYGVDTRNSSIENWNGSYTGYTMRKFLDPDPAIVHQTDFQLIPFPILKYTASLLNYIETLINLGEEEEARSLLSQIRFRAGLPAVTATGDELMEVYRNERLIELAYEEHRFFDARRWMIAPEVFDEDVRVIDIQGTLRPGAEVEVYRYDPELYDYTYTPRVLSPGIEDREWKDKMYFGPIPRSEMNRNVELIQNPGFESAE